MSGVPCRLGGRAGKRSGESQQRVDVNASLGPVLRSDGEVAHTALTALLQALDIPPLELLDGIGLGDLEAKGERAIQVPAGVGDELLATETEGAEAGVVGAVGQRGAPPGVSTLGQDTGSK